MYLKCDGEFPPDCRGLAKHARAMTLLTGEPVRLCCYATTLRVTDVIARKSKRRVTPNGFYALSLFKARVLPKIFIIVQRSGELGLPVIAMRRISAQSETLPL